MKTLVIFLAFTFLSVTAIAETGLTKFTMVCNQLDNIAGNKIAGVMLIEQIGYAKNERFHHKKMGRKLVSDEIDVEIRYFSRETLPKNLKVKDKAALLAYMQSLKTRIDYKPILGWRGVREVARYIFWDPQSEEEKDLVVDMDNPDEGEYNIGVTGQVDFKALHCHNPVMVEQPKADTEDYVENQSADLGALPAVN